MLHPRAGIGLTGHPPLDAAVLARRATRDDEVADVRALLLDHQAPGCDAAAAAAVAEVVALACLGDRHLWQDLQLPSRRELTALMGEWFPALQARNAHDMKWKKFLYKQLCERAEVFVCQSPTCAACPDVSACFGPE